MEASVRAMKRQARPGQAQLPTGERAERADHPAAEQWPVGGQDLIRGADGVSQEPFPRV